MSQKIVFREFQARDTMVLSDLFIQAIQVVYPELRHGAWVDDLKDVDNSYLQAGGCVIVGEIDDEIVAMGALKPAGEGVCEMKRVAVSPKHQAKGVGQALLTAIEGKARELGFEKLILDTTYKQAAARKLYNRNGYQLVDRKEIAHPSGKTFDTFFYEKIL